VIRLSFSESESENLKSVDLIWRLPILSDRM